MWGAFIREREGNFHGVPSMEEEEKEVEEEQRGRGRKRGTCVSFMTREGFPPSSSCCLAKDSPTPLEFF